MATTDELEVRIEELERKVGILIHELARVAESLIRNYDE